MYKCYNANAIGNFTDDCVIRAISCATNKSWDYTYNKISDIAQWEGTTMDNREFIIEYLDRNYERMPKFYGTIGEASEYYKDNIILVTTIGHIVCSKYGEIYDTWNSSGRKVEFIWLIS